MTKKKFRHEPGKGREYGPWYPQDDYQKAKHSRITVRQSRSWKRTRK